MSNTGRSNNNSTTRSKVALGLMVGAVLLPGQTQSFTVTTALSPVLSQLPTQSQRISSSSSSSALYSSKASSRRKGSRRNKKEGNDKDQGKDENNKFHVGFGTHHNGHSNANLHHNNYHKQQSLSIRRTSDNNDDDEDGNETKSHLPLSIPQMHELKHHHRANHHQNHHNQHSNLRNPVSKLLSHILPNQDQPEQLELTSGADADVVDSPKDQNNKYPLVSATPEWKELEKHARYIETTHLRDLLQDPERCSAMFAETSDGVYLDYSRQRVTLETMDLLFDLAERQGLKDRITEMVCGKKINWTEDRAVLHTALRGERDMPMPGSGQRSNERIIVDGEDVMEEVWNVLDDIKYFTEAVRSGEITGFTGKRLRNIISVGIGGSYLGPEFLHECLKTEPEGINKSLGYTLRFLSNVDPVDVERACADLDPEETLIVIVSKTFTTAETMLNARTMRQWLWDFMGDDKEVVRKHIVAVSSISSVEKVEDFGIDTEKYFFRFWDWVGGRYSVCSAVGGLPISLLYGFDLFEKFLQGARSIDKHFIETPLRQNVPVLMGLLGVWNMSFMGYTSRATMPYAEALLKLPAHIQQLDMESNGKKATKSGMKVDYPVGEVDFGEPGTNGQHSFFQLLHMGQTVPCEFIGFLKSQHDLCIDGETLSSHDELMSNFFAQPDALANGKTEEEVRAEGIDEDLIVHRTFEGNRPSLSILAPKLTAYSCGQLLAIYEHRTAVQGFIWEINSFDQWGVELGKKLASDVKDHLLKSRTTGKSAEAGNPATSRILNYYLENSEQAPCEDLWDANPLTSVTRKTHKEHFPPVGHDLKSGGGKLI